METFFGEIRGSVTNLMTKEVWDLDSVKDSIQDRSQGW